MNLEQIDDSTMWTITQTALHLPALTAAIRLGVLEALADGALTVPELSARTQLHERPLYALSRLLGALGLIELGERLALTPTARKYLLRSSSSFWGPLLERMAALPLNAAALETAARRDDAALYAESDIWAVHDKKADAARAFALGAHCRALDTATRLAHSNVLDGVRTLLDVGGGLGTYSVAFALKHPELEVTLLDIGAVCPLAEEYAREQGVGRQVRVHPADMFGPALPTTEVVFMSDVLHDWPADRCRLLLARAFSALPPRGRVLLNEVLLDEDGAGPIAAISYDLAMLLSTQGGRQYRLSELTHLLAEAGFAEIRVGSKFSVHTLISGTKPI